MQFRFVTIVFVNISYKVNKATQRKAEFVLHVVQTQEALRTRQILAIFGLLLYAASVLDLAASQYHYALRFLSEVAATPLTKRHVLPKDVREALSRWAHEAAVNNEVPVFTLTPTAPALIIYTDASAWGWGALSIKGCSARPISRAWNQSDRAMWDLGSSVTAEPLAIIKAISFFVPLNSSRDDTNIQVHIVTDHMPLIYAVKKGWGKAFAYSYLCTFLARVRKYNVHCTFFFVNGAENPADPLSRGAPPLLEVTQVGTRIVKGVIGNEVHG